MQLVAALEWLTALLGHAAIGCAAYNQLHAHSWPRPSRKVLDYVVYAIWLALAIALAVPMIDGETIPRLGTVLLVYSRMCQVVWLVVAARWLLRLAIRRPPKRLREHRSEFWDTARVLESSPLHGWQARWLGKIPGNQVLQPVAEFRTIALRGRPPGADRLRIVQLSDLHLNGKIGIEFFMEVARRCNALQPDVFVVTGDLIDEPECLPWLADVLGSLQARLGRFYVLGNHDRRLADERALRQAMARTGFEPVGGCWRKLETPGGRIWICGNELPWYAGADSMSFEPPGDLTAPRILLAHSPDQFRWALRRGIDLMLCGHCHGGQIRLPWIGPIITPSRHGVRFASGGFEFGGLSLWVSRGVSGDEPIRLNCPPEVSVFDVIGA